MKNQKKRKQAKSLKPLVIILLQYFSFGQDNPSGTAKNFSKLMQESKKEDPIRQKQIYQIFDLSGQSILVDSSKMSSLLKRMKEDGLLRSADPSGYELNPH